MRRFRHSLVVGQATKYGPRVVTPRPRECMAHHCASRAHSEMSRKAHAARPNPEEPVLIGPENRRARRFGWQSWIEAARAVLSGRAKGQAKGGTGNVGALRALLVARRS